jgi:hypothetical protein
MAELKHFNMEYKSKRHQEIVEDFQKNHTIVECLKSCEGQTCVYNCVLFYNCWVRELDEKDKLQEASKLEKVADGI